MLEYIFLLILVDKEKQSYQFRAVVRRPFDQDHLWAHFIKIFDYLLLAGDQSEKSDEKVLVEER